MKTIDLIFKRDARIKESHCGVRMIKAYPTLEEAKRLLKSEEGFKVIRDGLISSFSPETDIEWAGVEYKTLLALQDVFAKRYYYCPICEKWFSNVNGLSIQLGLSETTVRRIINRFNDLGR